MNWTDLYAIICQRRDNPSAGSYTARLIAEGEDRVLQKVGEEAVEVLIAAKGQGRQRLIEETADLTYHLLVLLAFQRITPQEIEAELEKRHKPAAG